jgi:hypothetical protein
MKKWIIYIGVTLLLGFNVVLMVKVKKTDSALRNLKVIEDKYQRDWNNIQTMLRLQFETVGTQLSDQYLLDSNWDTILFSDITDPQGSLVLWFSQESCIACYEKELYNLEIFSSGFDSSRIFVLSDLNPRNLNILRARFKYNFKFFSLTDKLKIPIEKYNYPVIMFVSKDLKCSNVFVPEKSLPKLSKIFFEEIRKKMLKE